MAFIKRFRYWIALVVLIVPILARTVWFYHGFPSLAKVQVPNYAANTVPQPPISTASSEQIKMAPGKIVVIDANHGNQFTPSEVEYFTSELTRRGAQVEIDNGDPHLFTRLKYASAYVVFSSSQPFYSEEISQVRDFVARGGRLIVFADPTRGMMNIDYYSGSITSLPDVDTVNPLLAPFKIAVNNDYLYNLVKNEGNFRNVVFGKFAPDPLTAGLTQVAFYGAHSVRTLDGKSLITGDQYTLSSTTDSGEGLSAAALGADGNVLVLGDFSFLVPPYNTVADNNVLIGRIADFALGGTRTHNIADFPYVFDRPVAVVPTGGLQMASDILEPIASLQGALQSINVSLTVNSDPPANTDLLVLGSLTPSDDLTPYIEPFKLGLDDYASITLPDFGTINRDGIGLLLYEHTADRNTLTLLTDYPSDLPSLISLLANGEVSSCMIQGEVGVCSIGYGGSSYNNSYNGSEYPDFIDTYPPEFATYLPPEGTLMPTSTPVK